jgi:hypothetical protein
MNPNDSRLSNSSPCGTSLHLLALLAMGLVLTAEPAWARRGDGGSNAGMVSSKEPSKPGVAANTPKKKRGEFTSSQPVSRPMRHGSRAAK